MLLFLLVMVMAWKMKEMNTVENYEIFLLLITSVLRKDGIKQDY